MDEAVYNAAVEKFEDLQLVTHTPNFLYIKLGVSLEKPGQIL